MPEEAIQIREWIPKRLYEAVRRQAKREDRPVREILARALTQYLRRKAPKATTD